VVELDFDVGPGNDAFEEHIGDASVREVADASIGETRAADAPSAGDALDAVEEVPAHCGGSFACAPAVPTGWVGPFELYEGSDPAPACESGFSGATLDGNAELSASAASCDCQCDMPQGLQCASPTIAFSSTSALCPTQCATATLTPGLCTTVDMKARCSLGVSGAPITVPTPAAPTQGSCAPVPTVGVAIPTWSTNARACGTTVAPARADCKGGNVCVPLPTSPFLTGLCIEQAGDVACPATDYTTKYLDYGGIDDSRSCSSCTCGPVIGATCSGTLTQYVSADGGCDTPQTIYALPQSCSPLQQPADVMLSLTPANGACKPSPVSATGAATPSTPMTFCCAP
jgi:hypothetical protein